MNAKGAASTTKRPLELAGLIQAFLAGLGEVPRYRDPSGSFCKAINDCPHARISEIVRISRAELIGAWT